MNVLCSYTLYDMKICLRPCTNHDTGISLLDFLSMKSAFYSCRYYIKFKEFSDVPIHKTLTFHTLHIFSYKYHYKFIEKIHPCNFHGIIFIGANVWIFNISWILHNFSWTKNLLVYIHKMSSCYSLNWYDSRKVMQLLTTAI